MRERGRGCFVNSPKREHCRRRSRLMMKCRRLFSSVWETRKSNQRQIQSPEQRSFCVSKWWWEPACRNENETRLIWISVQMDFSFHFYKFQGKLFPRCVFTSLRSEWLFRAGLGCLLANRLICLSTWFRFACHISTWLSFPFSSHEEISEIHPDEFWTNLCDGLHATA